MNVTALQALRRESATASQSTGNIVHDYSKVANRIEAAVLPESKYKNADTPISAKDRFQ
jgi:hypothetical protein